MAYTPLRHAYVGETKVHGDRLLPVEWVMLSRWDHDSGDVEFCVEYLDRATEIAAQDESFDSLAEAEHHATEQFRTIHPANRLVWRVDASSWGRQVECLFDLGLAVEVPELPADLAAIDALLANPALLEPVVAAWDEWAREHGRPSIPIER